MPAPSPWRRWLRALGLILPGVALVVGAIEAIRSASGGRSPSDAALLAILAGAVALFFNWRRQRDES